MTELGPRFNFALEAFCEELNVGRCLAATFSEETFIYEVDNSLKQHKSLIALL